MLKPSYAAFEQFQSEKKSVHSFQSLKKLLKRLGLTLSIEVESSTVWQLTWDICEGRVSGTLEISVRPSLSNGQKLFEKHYPMRFRLEEPVPIGMDVLEGRLVKLLKTAIDTI